MTLLSVYIVSISSILLVTLFLLFKAENSRGKRFILGRLRERLDQAIFKRTVLNQSGDNFFANASIRLFLHFMLHQLLGAALYIIKIMESFLSRVRRHNHRVAHQAIPTNTDNHLSHMARHKEEMSLNEEQKAKLRERSLND